MVAKKLIVVVASAAAVAGSAIASPSAFLAQAHLQPTGCVQTLSGTVVKLRGCRAAGETTGTVRGRLSLSYTANASIARGAGAQRGTLTLSSASVAGRLVARFSGVISIASGVSSGRWTAVARTGVFVHLVGHTGTYVSRTPDQGVHVTFDVHG